MKCLNNKKMEFFLRMTQVWHFNFLKNDWRKNTNIYLDNLPEIKCKPRILSDGKSYYKQFRGRLHKLFWVSPTEPFWVLLSSLARELNWATVSSEFSWMNGTQGFFLRYVSLFRSSLIGNNRRNKWKSCSLISIGI